jgi:hypothetical protein
MLNDLSFEPHLQVAARVQDTPQKLFEYRVQYSKTIRDSAEFTNPVKAISLEAGYFRDFEFIVECAYIEGGIDLKAIHIRQVQRAQAIGPKSMVSVA